MVNVGVPLPALFLPGAGPPAISFDMWMKMFYLYLLAMHTERDDWHQREETSSTA